MGDENLKQEIKESCMDKSGISHEFVKHCVCDIAGADIVNKLKYARFKISFMQ